MFAFKFLDRLYDSWEGAREELRLDLEALQSALNKKWETAHDELGNITVVNADAVTGADLSKTNDTNVTLTLGGTPTGALLKAVTLVLGWTGRLAFSRFVQASGASKLAGRGSASGAGDFEEITLGSGLTMTGTVLDVGTVGVTQAQVLAKIFQVTP